MKKKIKFMITIIIFVLSIIMLPLVYSKYSTVFNKKLTVNVRKPEYTIVFHSNNGSDSTVSQNHIYGTSKELTENSFSNSGYIFKNWNTENDETGVSYDDLESVINLSSIDGDIIDLYAIWAPDFTVVGNLDTWTNQNITLTIVLTEGSYNDYDYSFDGGITWESNYSKEFSSNQDVHIKIRDHSGYESKEKIESITKIDKIAPTISYDNSIEYNVDHSTNQVTTLITTLGSNTSITKGVNTSDNLSGVATSYPKCYRNDNELTSTNVFTDIGRYEITCKVQDKAGNETTLNREVLVRWPTGGKYVVKKTERDGSGIAGEGHSSSTSPDGLYKDTMDTGYYSSIPFSSKYYYAGASVDNYITFAGKTFRILNIASNNDIKLLGDISDQTSTWGSYSLTNPIGHQIYKSDIYDTWSTKWWPRGQIYNHVTNNNNELIETKYLLFSDIEKSHIDLATFYAGRVDDNDDISGIIFNEQTNAERLGGDSASFEGYSAYPNVSDILKACKAHDLFDTLEDIDTGSVYSTRQRFKSYIWIDASSEFWIMNGRTGASGQNNDYWTIDSDMGIHFESRGYSLSRKYRVVFYITDTTIISGEGTTTTPYNVEEDWAWFDSYQIVQ